jgi:hypothetical protein
VTLASALKDQVERLLVASAPEDLELVIEAAVLVAHADLHIDPAEHDALRITMEAVMRSRLAPMVVKTWIGSALDNLRAVGGEAFASRLGKELARRGAAEHGYRIATLLALSSEGVSASEKGYLSLLGEAAGLSEAQMEAFERESAAALAPA